jgi:hypothetical protein
MGGLARATKHEGTSGMWIWIMTLRYESVSKYGMPEILKVVHMILKFMYGHATNYRLLVHLRSSVQRQSHRPHCPLAAPMSTNLIDIAQMKLS